MHTVFVPPLHSTTALLFFLVFGVVFGSFGTVLVARVPGGKSILGRSQCPHCNAVLRFFELVPVLSFFLQRGRCRRCEASIGIFYVAIECASAVIFLCAALLANTIASAALLALALWLLFLCAMTDLQTQTVPDLLSIPFLLLSLAYTLLIDQWSVTGPLLGGGFFLAQYLVSRGRWVGSGDILLGLAVGVLLGSWQSVLVALIASYIVGAVIVSVLMAVLKWGRKTSVPFIPFLTIGTFIAVFFGEKILAFYR